MINIFTNEDVAFTEKTVTLVNGDSGRLDYALKVGEHKYEIYELKPITWYKNAKLNISGKDQLNGYISGINLYGFRGDSAASAVAGTSWNPNGLVIKSPFDPKKEIAFYTYKSDPGMIYYGERKRPDNKITIKEPQTVWDKVKDFFSADYYPNGVPLPNNMPPLGEKNSGGTWLPIPRRGIPFMPLR